MCISEEIALAGWFASETAVCLCGQPLLRSIHAFADALFGATDFVRMVRVVSSSVSFFIKKAGGGLLSACSCRCWDGRE